MIFRSGLIASFLAFILASPFMSKAEELRDCSVKALTKNCTQFAMEENPLNPWRLEAQADPNIRQSMDVTMTQSMYGGQGDPEKMMKWQSSLLKIQSDLLFKLSLGSPVFKLAVTSPNTLQNLAYSLQTEETEGRTTVPAYTVPLNLPWPPNDPKAKIQTVSREDFKKEYLDKLPPKERQLLYEKGKEAAEAANEFYQMSQPIPEGPSEEEILAQKIRQSKIQELKKQQQARAERLFKQAQKYLIEEIKARPFTSAENQKKLIQKLKTITFSGIENGTESCAQDAVNAFYDPSAHSFNICSGTMDASDMSLIWLIGHELGHSIGPCNSQKGIFKVASYNDQKMKDYFTKQGIGEANNEMLRTALSGSSPQRVSGNLNALLSYKQTKDLEEMGVLKAVSEGVEGTYPLDTVSRCLKESYHLFDGETSGNSLVEKRVQRLKTFKPEIFDSAPWSLSRCSEMSEVNEAMADVFGAKVMARYAADQEKTSFKDLQSGVAMLLPNACADVRSRPELLTDFHPWHQERIEKIIIADPLMKKLFHCKDAPGARPYCMNKFGHTTIPQKAPAAKDDKSPGSSRSMK